MELNLLGAAQSSQDKCDFLFVGAGIYRAGRVVPEVGQAEANLRCSNIFSSGDVLMKISHCVKFQKCQTTFLPRISWGIRM